MDEHDCPDDCGMQPLVYEAAASITEAMAKTFDELWHRDDAAFVVERFLARTAAFVVTRDGIEIRVVDDAP